MLAMFNYESAHGHFPPAFSTDADGNALLSWRVLILPYLEDQNLYDQFHLDEPWDSEHNKKLIEKMPSVFAEPSSGLGVKNKTHYLAVVGESYMFDPSGKATKLMQVRDGLSNTIAFLQADDSAAATWTEPRDWRVDPVKQGLAGLDKPVHPGVFLAAFGDGHIESVSYDIDLEVFKAMLTRDGREVINR